VRGKTPWPFVIVVVRGERIVRWAFGTLLGVALVAALVIVVFGWLGAVSPNRVYTAAEVQAGLRQHPQAWAGRTVQVTGAVIMQVMGNCPTSAPACTPPTWVFLGRLGPEGKPASSVALAHRMTPAQRMALVRINMINQQRAFALVSSGLSRLGRGAPPSLRVSEMEQALLLSVPAGLYVAPQMRRPLPDALYDLPLVGEPLSRLFPWNTRLIVSVRLTSLAACPTRSTATCPDGTVLAS